MTNTRPPGRGSPYNQPPMYPEEQRGYGANLPYGFAGERRPIEPPRRRRSGFGTVLLYFCVALLALGAGAATFFFMSPPTDFIRREIIAGVKRETGRDLTIGGGASFTLLPSFGLKLDDVSLSAPQGMGGEPLVRMTSFNVGVQMMPLLRRQIVVDRVELNDPVFSLRVDANGRRSWDMAAAEPHGTDDRLAPVRLRFAEAMPGQGFAGLLVSPAVAAPNGAPVLSLDNILVRNGALRYTDERNGAWGRFDGLNAQFSLPAIDQPLTGTGTLVSEGETFQFKSTLTTPADLTARRSARLQLTVSGMPLTFRYDGTVGAHEGVGTLTANAPSLSALAHWWGHDVSSEAAAGEVAFTAHLNASPAGVILSAIDLKAGPAAATGTVGFTERAGERPHVAAELAVSGLDIAALPLGANLRAGRAATPAPTPLSLDLAPDATPQRGAEPNSIDDLLERPGPRVKGYTRREGWSTEPIDIKALGLADVDARLTLTDVTYKQTRIDSAKVVLSVQDLVARVTLTDLQLYGGTGQGTVVLDASGNAPAITSEFSLAAVAAEPILRDAAQVDWLNGKADVAWKVTGQGASEADIVRSLNGGAQVALKDGEVKGFDLGAAMHELSEGSLPHLARDPSKRTDFRSLTGTFTVASGVATNNDLQLDSRHLHATGAGTVNLPQRTLDYTVRPKLVANLQGDQGEKNAVGIEVPVHVTGPWQEPEFAPDIAGALNSQGTVDAVKEIGKQLKGKNAGEIVKDLFGKGENGGPSKAEKLLDNFFGKQ